MADESAPLAERCPDLSRAGHSRGHPLQLEESLAIGGASAFLAEGAHLGHHTKGGPRDTCKRVTVERIEGDVINVVLSQERRQDHCHN